METMSQYTKDILRRSGWFEGRKIDVEPIVKLLNERGFDVFPIVISFIEEYGMLDIKAPSHLPIEIIKQYNFKNYDEHTTDVFKALGDAGDYYCTVPFEKFAKEKMIIVGEIDDRNLMLMVSESGKVYCDSGKLGDNFSQAWERLFSKESCIAWQYL